MSRLDRPASSTINKLSDSANNTLLPDAIIKLVPEVNITSLESDIKKLLDRTKEQSIAEKLDQIEKELQEVAVKTSMANGYIVRLQKAQNSLNPLLNNPDQEIASQARVLFNTAREYLTGVYSAKDALEELRRRLQAEANNV